jgi:hypothetical protein
MHSSLTEGTLHDGPEHVQRSHGVDVSLSVPPDVEPCCDIEWLENEARRLDRLEWDAPVAAAKAIRELILDMDAHAVWSIRDLDARREAVKAAEWKRHLDDVYAAANNEPTPEETAAYHEYQAELAMEARIGAKIHAAWDDAKEAIGDADVAQIEAIIEVANARFKVYGSIFEAVNDVPRDSDICPVV